MNIKENKKTKSHIKITKIKTENIKDYSRYELKTIVVYK